MCLENNSLFLYQERKYTDDRNKNKCDIQQVKHGAYYPCHACWMLCKQSVLSKGQVDIKMPCF